MKRAIALLILILCLISNIACAEEVTLPNGLQFGMNIAEAVATSGYARSTLRAGDKQYFSAYYGASFLEDCIYQDVVIGGMDAEMLVLFDDSGLRQIRYRFVREEVGDSKAYTPGELVSASYQTVEDSLKRKYGETLDPLKNHHMYMPPVDQEVFGTYVVKMMGYTFNVDFLETALIPTLRIVEMADGSSVCIDNYVQVNIMGGVQHHELTYTCYDFEIDNTTHSNSIDF